ncbi:MAG TPA: DUF6011 domain-containing protein [Scandinavium sp.]|jgi:hypothetical protein|uniref:DUF6011 domain-containing protein n=1 Tax=Scandinavium sp. TaxID=2830653 RepID=UPI002E370099|nr:DUF6011 domain-containing protein [Scandinavium sp.]HEX4502174.1 DUF6011 domain-containing protein [Scandinavium sp.]
MGSEGEWQFFDITPQPGPKMASERQLSFIKDLILSKNVIDRDGALARLNSGELTLDQASTWIGELKALPYRPKVQKTWTVPENIPDGRYAIVGKDRNFKFFRVVTRNPDTINATRIVQKVLGAPGDFRYVRPTESEWTMAVEEITKDPGFHSALFGMKVGACGVCGSPLTDPESIALGIGPICARKYDW